MTILRDYQKEAIQDTIIVLAGYNSVLLEAPTGSGKTFIAKHIIQHYLEQGKNVLFIVANSPLVKQTHKAFDDLHPSIIYKSQHDYNPDTKLQIAMLHTLYSRLNKIESFHPNLIFMDEVDFCIKGEMIKAVRAKYPDAKFIGCTATPIDDAGFLLPNFEYYIKVCSVKYLQYAGYLSKDINYIPGNVDVSKIGLMQTGDFDNQQLGAECSKHIYIENIVDRYLEHDKGYSTLVYAVNVAHAKQLHAAFDKDFNVDLVHCGKSKYQNDHILEMYTKGLIQILISVGMLIRGYDAPNIIDIVDCAPTMSERKYLQKIGRGCRIDSKGLNFFRYFDFAGNIERQCRLWSDDVVYQKDNRPPRLFKPFICPWCFAVVVNPTRVCPECDKNLKPAIQRAAEVQKEIQYQKSCMEMQEIKCIQYQKVVAQKLCWYKDFKFGLKSFNAGILKMRPTDMDIELFYALYIRTINRCRTAGNPKSGYLYYKLKNVFEK